ncbi:hypothetical protein BT67DRAFT_432436 [Trichocladium antarcticum]|uniref:Uncharacterized protein n=1 Tax=Trichocladium antarcticum TaxID=1450529 RepID=A0AAN6ZGC3_9PEZI|nr:hypothetical protein BT67DRAFT_432436 [Trichocladium antarcticum]
MRDLAFNPDGYYAPPTPARQQLGARSSSVSSTSSSTSYAGPYSTASNHHGSISRTISPAVGMSDAGSGAVAFGRSHYQGLAHEHPLVPSPPPYLQVQAGPSISLYSPMPSPRQFPRSSPYDYHPLGTLPQQPSPLSYQTFHPPPMYPSQYAATSYHSSPALPSYQVPLVRPPMSMIARPESPKESFLLKMLQRLPAVVVAEIHKNLTWFECWKVYRVCRWMRDHFHPDRLPEDMRFAGVFYAEQYYGRYGQPDTPDHSPTVTKRSADNKKGPPWFACYHCYTIKGFEHFELYKWNITSKEGAHSEGNSPRLKQEYTPPSTPTPTGNPHYDPTLTRSSLAAAARNGRQTSSTLSIHREGSPKPENPRIRETWGIRRYCLDCGLSKRIYQPNDLIELRKQIKPREAAWVCGCWKIRWRPERLHCADCGYHTPLSMTPRRGPS